MFVELDIGDKRIMELKPCPFCGCGTGNLYVVTIEQHGFDTVGIFCNGCKQTMILEENEWEGDNEQSRIRAIEAWNRRVGEENGCSNIKSKDKI